MAKKSFITSIVLFMCISIGSSCVIAVDYFDGISFGAYVEITESGGGGDSFDGISFGAYVEIKSGNGSTGFGPWREFYLLSNRYDVDVNSIVDVNDCGYVYVHFGGSDYLYDVYPEYSGDDVIDINDCGGVYVNFT